MAVSSTINQQPKETSAMDTRITDLVAGLLLGGANAFGATALVTAAQSARSRA